MSALDPVRTHDAVSASELEWKPEAAPGFAPPGLDDLAERCVIFPEHRSRTADKFLFLREIGGPSCLHEFLQNVIANNENGMKHAGGTLIIDQEVELHKPLVLPSEFTLAGVGMNGRGRIKAVKDFGGPAIMFDQGSEAVARPGKSAVRDLAIEGPGSGSKTGGIWVGLLPESVWKNQKNTQNFFDFQRVRVSGFEYGIAGGINAWNATVDGCHLLQNRTNLQLTFQCNSWRIRDCLVEQAAGRWGIDIGRAFFSKAGIFPAALNHVMISGCRFRNNRPGGIQLTGGDTHATRPFGVTIFGNFFQRNNETGVSVGPGAMATRIVANYLDMDEKIVLAEPIMMGKPMPLASHMGFNVSSEMFMGEEDIDVNLLWVARP